MSKQERRDKFVNLAESRVIKTIKQLRLIGNLANKGNYDYQADDVEKIIKALNDEIKALRSRFETPGKGSEPAFTLRTDQAESTTTES